MLILNIVSLVVMLLVAFVYSVLVVFVIIQSLLDKKVEKNTKTIQIGLNAIARKEGLEYAVNSHDENSEYYAYVNGLTNVLVGLKRDSKTAKNIRKITKVTNWFIDNEKKLLIFNLIFIFYIIALLIVNK